MLSRATFQNRPSSRQLLARLLEAPDLPERVRALPGAQLGKLIRRVGLEDAAELVALATTEQLARVFDEDLWHSSRAGEDERFDSGRFVLWLEVMLEAGEAVVASKLAELPPDLVTLAVHRHVLVLSQDDLRSELSADDDEAEAAEKALASSLSEELEDFQLIWRGGEGWDAVFNALVALDRDHHQQLVELLERCAALAREQLDDGGGLYEVLTAEQTLEEDLAGAREERRAREGHVAPSAAAAFLKLARLQRQETPFTQHDPLTRAYFRSLAPSVAAAPASGGPAALVGAGTGASSEPLMILALRELRERAPEVFAERSEELAYLVNVLLAAHEQDGARLRPYQAVELAIGTVSRGLALLDPSGPDDRAAMAAQRLQQYPCDGLFRLAWSQPRERSASSGRE